MNGMEAWLPISVCPRLFEHQRHNAMPSAAAIAWCALALDLLLPVYGHIVALGATVESFEDGARYSSTVLNDLPFIYRNYSISCEDGTAAADYFQRL